jgi:hypothetical protein
MAEFDFSELSKLSADLGESAQGVGKFVGKALEVSARNIKDETRDKYKGAAYLPGAARSITYDVTEGSSFTNGNNFQAEIGPQLGGQGSIVGLVELGKGKVAPRGYLTEALHNEQEGFERGIDRAVDDSLKEHGL